MSIENVRRFLDETLKDACLRAGIEEAAEKVGDDREHFEEKVRDIGKERGFVFTRDEYRDFLKKRADGKMLSPEDLDGVAGGMGGVVVEQAEGNVTIIDRSTTTIQSPDMSFMYYLIDKLY